jgi:hypothetical protein
MISPPQVWRMLDLHPRFRKHVRKRQIDENPIMSGGISFLPQHGRIPFVYGNLLQFHALFQMQSISIYCTRFLFQS